MFFSLITNIVSAYLITGISPNITYSLIASTWQQKDFIVYHF